MIKHSKKKAKKYLKGGKLRAIEQFHLKRDASYLLNQGGGNLCLEKVKEYVKQNIKNSVNSVPFVAKK
jgi:hypothetical protein